MSTFRGVKLPSAVAVVLGEKEDLILSAKLGIFKTDYEELFYDPVVLFSG